MAARIRQEVLNVHLAHLLREAAVDAIAEVIAPPVHSAGRHMPDVLIDYRGLRVMFEAELADTPNAEQKALQSARNRVEHELAQIAVAVVYPAELRETEGDPSSILSASTLRVAVVTEEGDNPYFDARIPDIVELLAYAQASLVKGEVVEQMAHRIEQAIGYFAITTNNFFGDVGRMSRELGLTRGTLAEIQAMNQDERSEFCRVGGLVLLNGLMFQEMLADVHPQVPANRPETDVIFEKDDICGIWARIIKDINYFSVFHLAYEIIIQVGRRKPVNNAANDLLRIAKEIVKSRTLLRHDLAGRVYHKLLRHQHYLATYYTTIPAATLLLKLTLGRAAKEYPFEDPRAIANLRLADLACGTGTLLVAAAEAITDAHVRKSCHAGRAPVRDELQQVLLEDVIYGLDVLPAAVHLTASSLSMRAPHVPVGRTHLYSVEHGGKDRKLGSLELLKPDELFAPLKIFTPDDLPHFPTLDFCVMNPPFTRSVGGNLLFGAEGRESTDRSAMQTELKALVKKLGLPANITAGLGSVFVALGDRYLKEGGRLALVLPKTLLAGPAWSVTRRLFAEKYVVEFVVCSHDPGYWNFSESTKLSETLVVARKRLEKEHVADDRTVFINLWTHLEKSVHALEVTRGVLHEMPPDLASSQGAMALLGTAGQTGTPLEVRTLFSGQSKAAPRSARQVGEAFSMPWKTLSAMPSWAIPSGFAQSDVARAALHLSEGRLWLPGFGVVTDVALEALKDQVHLGPDCRDIHDGFVVADSKTSYPALWGNRSSSLVHLSVELSHYLRPRAKAAPKRPLRRVESLWPKAGELMIAERLRLNTHRIAACFVHQPALSNVWWPCREHEDTKDKLSLKLICLWLNSTLGILSLLGVRTETEGPWIKLKKPSLGALLVPARSTLGSRKTKKLLHTFDTLTTLPLQPIAALGVDPNRRRIDEAVSDLLGLPDLARLRELLANEPLLSGRRLGE